MEIRRRLASASALTVTVALAGVVAANPATADPLPPKTAQAAAALPSAADAAAPAEPTFVNGMAQPVFAATEAEWVNEEFWVESTFDSDNDGKLDRLHVDVSRPKETQTDGLKVPVIYEDSPYYSGTNNAVANWAVDHEIGFPPAMRPPRPFFRGSDTTSPRISTRYESTWVPRGFAVVHSESPGSGHSDGCPTTGGTNETLGATNIIDWLNGRAKAYTTRTGNVEAPAVNWHNGNTGMIGTSYNGTIPIAAASTGVEGLKAIIPVSAISDWYDYYRANGAVRAPGGFQGEDLDVLADYVYSRKDEGQTPEAPRSICNEEINELAAKQDRVTGDRSDFWQVRNYMKDIDKVKAASLVAHGNGDFNVMTKHAAQYYEALKARGVPHMFYFHQGGHGGEPPHYLQNLWFSKYLYGVDNGVETLPRSWVVRETTAGACPTRNATVSADSTTATLTVSNASAFRVGNLLSIPQTNTTTGAVTTITRNITNIAGNVITLESAVGSDTAKVASGALVFLQCGQNVGQVPYTNNAVPYADWPDPTMGEAKLQLGPGGGARGALTLGGAATTVKEKLIDDATVTPASLMNAASEDSRLLYVTNPLTQNVRISGTPKVSLNVAFSKTKANLTAYLVSLPATGNGTVLTRGWKDPENRTSDWTTEAITPGTFYKLDFDLQPKDVVVEAGRRLGLMVMSSDRDYTVRPAPGGEVTLDLGTSSFSIPVVGGSKVFATATGGDQEDGTVGGSVPATLSLALDGAAAFEPFIPGTAKDYTATTNATVTSTAGNATLSVSEPGRMTNGAFTLPEPLRVEFAKSSWNGPTSGEKVGITFKQLIKANDPLRTGSYSKTLTFTLSTTAP